MYVVIKLFSRLLLLARQDPDRFSLTQQLMDHEEERRGGADWVTTERTVVARLVEDCGAAEHEGFTREEVRCRHVQTRGCTRVCR